MPKTTRKTRSKRKDLKEQDDTESESGKLSETQEVAKRLSRTRLGKENTLKRGLRSHTNSKGPSDPYDADSEVESDANSQTSNQDSRSVMSPMVVEPFTEIPISSVPRALRPKASKLFYHDQSTPSTVTPGCSDGRSDDSLFGFGSALESPLPFSPVVMASTSHSETSSLFSVSSSTTSISPGKRKLQLRIFDMPVEKPSKKMKKKKTNQNKQASGNDFQDVMSEFQEVEMFSLAID